MHRVESALEFVGGGSFFGEGFAQLHGDGVDGGEVFWLGDREAIKIAEVRVAVRRRGGRLWRVGRSEFLADFFAHAIAQDIRLRC